MWRCKTGASCELSCRLGYWTYGGPPEQDPFGGADAAEHAACLRSMRLSAAGVLDWMHKQHVPGVNERKRREKLQPVLTAMCEPYSAEELPGIAVYRSLHRDAGLQGDKTESELHRRLAHRSRLYQLELRVAPETADSVGRDAVQLCTGRTLHFPPTRRKDGWRGMYMCFDSVAEAAQARDEALFGIFGLCASTLNLIACLTLQHQRLMSFQRRSAVVLACLAANCGNQPTASSFIARLRAGARA